MKTHWLCKTCDFGIVWMENNIFNKLIRIRAFCTLMDKEVGDVANCKAYDEEVEDNDDV